MSFRSTFYVTICTMIKINLSFILRHLMRKVPGNLCHCLVLRKTHNTYLMQIKAGSRILAVSRIQTQQNGLSAPSPKLEL